MGPHLPQKLSLVNQTLAYLKQEIAAGTWGEWLPGERLLCDRLRVSRNTLRSAIAQLKKARIVRARHGAGNQILTRATQPLSKLRSQEVALLTPASLERLRPAQTLWIDELRGMLNEHGCRLHIFHGPQYFAPNPAATLRKLVDQTRCGCWILTLGSRKMQSWFADNQVPCVVAGSTYPGIDLPFRDLDHRAICRHAAGTLLGMGHRKIGLVIEKSQRAGDLESEAGFLDGTRNSTLPNVQGVIVHHDSQTTGISRVLRRLMDEKNPPTALLVANPYHYLTVASWLAQAGMHIPHQVSLLSRDEDMFLPFLIPEPARYSSSAHSLAKSLLAAVLELLEGGKVTSPHVSIMPEFIRGETLARLPGRP